MRSFKVLPIVAFSLLAVGCTMIPEYERPEAPVEQAFPEGEAYKDIKYTEYEKNENEQPQMPTWESFFTNAQVKKVIEMALENNRDLRVAIYNVQRAKAAYGIQRADLLPSLSGTADMSAGRTPPKLSSTGSPYTSHTYTANLAVASWEIDIFGRIRSLTESALQNYLATEENQMAIQNSLIAEVAIAWINVGAQKELLRLQQVTLKSQQESYKLMKDSYDYGASSLLDLEQARTTVETARASLIQYQRTLAQARNALAALVGARVPPNLEPPKLIAASTLSAIAPKGLTSAILLDRPDIRAAENNLKSANADIGAARANFFPRISLTGSVGRGSTALGDLFHGPHGMWSFAPDIYLPIFNGGAQVYALEEAEAEKKIMIATYEGSIQSAFKEVADALAADGTMQRQCNALKSLVSATKKAYELSYSRYKNGLDAFLNVLESQRQMVSAQTELILAEQNRLANNITLYRVLGGGSVELQPAPEDLEEYKAAKAAAEKDKPIDDGPHEANVIRERTVAETAPAN